MSSGGKGFFTLLYRSSISSLPAAYSQAVRKNRRTQAAPGAPSRRRDAARWNGLNWRRQETIDLGQPLFCLLFLALFFFGGVVLGQVFSSRVPPAAGEELSRYLTDFVEVEEALAPEAALSAAVLYFRYPLLAALLGFASIGLLLLPAVSAAFGFFLSFSVCCFTAAFGPDGVILALAVFGLRCAVTLPCFFLVAVPSWGASAALARLSLEIGRASCRERVFSTV